jgi:hypothetical protein
MKRSLGSCLVVLIALASQFNAIRALGDQYPYLDPSYTQEIYAGPGVDAGMAWTSGNNLLTRNGSTIREYSLTQNTSHQGTPLHGVIATHTITGLNNSGTGMTNGLDGYIYAVTSSGLQRFDPSNWAAPAQTLAGTAGGVYGITTLSDGRIAYTDSAANSNVYVYDPVGGTNTLIYTSNALVDGMVSGPSGNLAITGQTNSTITILTATGSVVNSFGTAHFPDGLAFAADATSATLYSNNNDGTISKYVLGPGYTGTPTIMDIATGSGAYGDLASVAPDCAFYVSQFENGSYHGATPGVGTNWDNAVTNAESSIIRIGQTVGPDGSLIDCAFYTPLHDVPEPSTVVMLMFGLVSLGLVGWRRRATVK